MSDIKNAKIEDKIMIALEKQQPKQPIRYELGGGYYYTCHWYRCNETVKRFMDYCPRCGQRIDWREQNG